VYFCADKSTKSSRQELLARTPLHRLIITKGLLTYDACSRIILSVMIAPSEPSISLRYWLANNSKGRCSWKLFWNPDFIRNYFAKEAEIVFVSELSNFLMDDLFFLVHIAEPEGSTSVNSSVTLGCYLW